MERVFEFSRAFLEHARNPRNLGPLTAFNGHGRIKGPCGDTMEFWILVKGGCLDQVSYVTDGCGSSHGCGSITTVLATGKTLASAILLGQRDVLFALGGLPGELEHCALLAVNTLQAACRDYLERHRCVDTPPDNDNTMPGYG